MFKPAVVSGMTSKTFLLSDRNAEKIAVMGPHMLRSDHRELR